MADMNNDYRGYQISTGFYDDDLYAVNDPTVDQAASADRYAERLEEALRAAFPAAAIEVRHAAGITGALGFEYQTHAYPPTYPEDGDDEGVEAAIDAIAASLFEAGDWVVDTAQEADA